MLQFLLIFLRQIGQVLVAPSCTHFLCLIKLDIVLNASPPREKNRKQIQNDESKGPIIYNFDSRFLSRHLNNTVSSYLGSCLFKESLFKFPKVGSN